MDQDGHVSGTPRFYRCMLHSKNEQPRIERWSVGEGDHSNPDQYALEIGNPDISMGGDGGTPSLRMRIRRIVYSTRFQYCVCFLAIIYLMLSIATFALDMTLKEHREKVTFGPITLLLILLEFSFNLAFFVEIILRVTGLGFIRYFGSFMNVLNIMVITSCAAIEFYCFYTNDPHLSSYSSILLPFRLWYVLRIIDQKNLSRDLSEGRRLIKTDGIFKENEMLMLKTKEENNQMTNDLAYMLELIDRIEKATRDGEERKMLSTRSSWQNFVPQQIPIKIRSKKLRRASSAFVDQKHQFRWSSLSQQEILSKKKRKNSNIF